MYTFFVQLLKVLLGFLFAINQLVKNQFSVLSLVFF